MPGTFASVLPSIKPPVIRRRHLRKYSWLPDVLRLKGSIISRIIGPVLTVTIWAALVAYAWSRGVNVVLTNSVVPLLSVVVGLILVFRNGSSYDRYWEGRKSFASMTSQVRNLTRLIWTFTNLPPAVPHPASTSNTPTPQEITPHQLRRRKIEALRLALSFVFATKHYLRGEDGTEWDDYLGVIPAAFLHRLDTGGLSSGYSATTTRTTTRRNSLHNATRNASASPRNMDASTDSLLSNKPTSERSQGTVRTKSPDATKRVRPKRSKGKLAAVQNQTNSASPLLGSSVLHRTVDFAKFIESTMPLPLIIAHELTRIVYQFRREGLLETVGPAGTNAMSQLIQGMVDQLTAMERVANTPIPISYGIHLKQCVTLYLFALPFTLIHDLGWSTIPVVTVVAFTFMGIEGIADEIEMPFGMDTSDLPLDRYCHDLREEVEYMIERLPEGGEGSLWYDDGEGDD